MAHQYPPATPHGAPYPPAAYYSPFNPAAGQQMSNGTPVFQQSHAHNSNLQPLVSVPNTVRYDSNTNVNPQPSPSRFIPHFNPDFLKNFPPPPIPPPLPNAHFATVPGTATAYMHFPQDLNATNYQVSQQEFPPFPQQPTPLNGGATSGQSITPSQDPRLQLSSQTQTSVSAADQLRPQTSSAHMIGDALVPNPSLGRSFDGGAGNYNSIPGLGQTNENILDVADNVAPRAGHIQAAIERAPVDDHRKMTNPSQPPQFDSRSTLPEPSSHHDLKDQAKMALVTLALQNIHYKEFVAEGVSPKVLTNLYGELGLNVDLFNMTTQKLLPTTASASSTMIVDAKPQERQTTVPQASDLGPTVSVAARVSPVGAAIPGASPTISPSMERKDRIAQLLAAKAGKGISPGVTSKSQSPISIPEPAHAPESATTTQAVKPVRNIAQTQIVKQKMEQLRREGIAKIQTEQAQNNPPGAIMSNKQEDIEVMISQAQLSAALPTPIREEIARNGLPSMIPGLFLTSADLEDDNLLPPPIFEALDRSNDQSLAKASYPQATKSSGNHKQISSPSPRSSRKRSLAEGSQTEGYLPEAKRQAVENERMLDTPMQTNDGTNDDVNDGVTDNASEGEITDEAQSHEQDRRESSENSAMPSPRTDLASEDYLTKQVQIEDMRKRIAEMEQRHNQKRGSSFVLSPTSSATSTPAVAVAPQTVLSSPLNRNAEQASAAVKADERGVQGPRSLVKATPEQIAERAAQLKADFLRQRALRQRQLQEGLPVLNDEVQKTQTKLKDKRLELAEVRKQVQQYESHIIRAHETESHLVKEIERLERQISDGISGQKLFSRELNNLQESSKDESVRPVTSSTTVEQASDTRDNVVQESLHDPSSGDASLEFENRSHENANAILSTASPRSPISSSASRMSNGIGASSASTKEEQDELGNHLDGRVPTVADSEMEEPSERETAVVESSTTLFEPMAEEEEEADDEGSVLDSDEAMEESDNESDDSRMSIDEESNGSISMSNSGSDEYEPAEPELSLESDEKTESDGYEPGLSGHQHYDGAAGGEGDEYEPTEEWTVAGDPSNMSVSQVSARSTMDQIPTTTPATVNLHSPSDTILQTVKGISQISGTEEEARAGDQENGLQLSQVATLTEPQDTLAIDEADKPHILGAAEPSSVRYVPYQSPLSSLKSYRFHPTFNDNVKEGYRSLTYSHKIDPKLPLCPTELNGVICNDPTCQDQHFSSMALTDDKILFQMSSAPDIREKSDRDRYLIGLKKVIANLRQEGVKEFEAVADALSQFRRDWAAASNGY